MTKLYESKIDTWLLVIYIGLIAVGLGVGIFLLISLKNAFAAIAIALFLALVAVVLPLWTLLRTYYVVSDGALTVRAGPFRWHVTITSIRSVKRCRDLEASPALSLNRLRIEFGESSHILVSPDDIEGFLADIQQSRAPAHGA